MLGAVLTLVGTFVFAAEWLQWRRRNRKMIDLIWSGVLTVTAIGLAWLHISPIHIPNPSQLLIVVLKPLADWIDLWLR